MSFFETDADETEPPLTESRLEPGDMVDDGYSPVDRDEEPDAMADAIVLERTGDRADAVDYPGQNDASIYDVNDHLDGVEPGDEVVSVAFAGTLDAHDYLKGWRGMDADELLVRIEDYSAEYGVVVQRYAYPFTRLALAQTDAERRGVDE